ncbi:hypothetical protein [Herbidospora daliensis]|uniref:hypothetical protein n=1 Tax=Herbidospora daliensis TaxID=295585 RepID=UPI000783CDB5|nr:hypothetical protein [Herbidospora daliensis]
MSIYYTGARALVHGEIEVPVHVFHHRSATRRASVGTWTVDVTEGSPDAPFHVLSETVTLLLGSDAEAEVVVLGLSPIWLRAVGPPLGWED